jgi:hypothetical protein
LKNVIRAPSDHKDEWHDVLIATVRKNPYVIATIPLELADQLFSLNNLPKELQCDLRWMGELLRRCHSIKGDKLYSYNGTGKKNYEQDIGIVIGNTEFNKMPSRIDYIQLINKYKRKYNLLLEITESSGIAEDGHPSTNSEVFIICDKYVVYTEVNIANYLCKDTRVCPQLSNITKENITEMIDKMGKTPSDDLVSAIHTSFNNPVSIITGEAGTRKTLAIQIIHKFCDHLNIGVRICSFTGKAIANIKDNYKNEWNGNPCEQYLTTIHSLLYAVYKPYIRQIQNIKISKKQSPQEFIWQTREVPFVLIIEEASMVPTWLIGSLLKYVSKLEHNLHIILVGDDNQLPPIGWGRFFHSIIKSNVLPLSTLTENYRTRGESGRVIVPNSRQYKQESLSCNLIWYNLHFCSLNQPIDFYLSHYRFIDSYDSMIIISPWRDRVNQINKRAQEILHSNSHNFIEYKHYSSNYRWYINDKVMITKNSKENNVYNGSDGIITGIDTTKELIVDKTKNTTYFFLSPNSNNLQKVSIYKTGVVYYNGNKYNYENFKELKLHVCQVTVNVSNKIVNLPILYEKNDDEDNDKHLVEYLTIQHLDLAYAVTTHKIQGSGRDIVVLDCDTSMPAYCIPGGKANIYTAITRTKKHFFYRGNQSLLDDVHHITNKVTYDRLPYLLKKIKAIF